jgi:hypothetical protein
MSATHVRHPRLTAPTGHPVVSAQQVRDILAELVYRLHVTRVVERWPVGSDEIGTDPPTVVEKTRSITVKKKSDRSSAKGRKDFASV